MADLKIGDLAQRAGSNPPTIRYYEQIGLLRPASRGGAGQRTYGQDDVRRMRFIRRCRDFGFPIGQVRSLLSMMENGAETCDEARALAQCQLTSVRAKLAELKALESAMVGLVASCDATCAGGAAPDCVIFDTLASLADPKSGLELQVT